MQTTTKTSGAIIATDVTYEAYIDGFQGQRVEWVAGEVIEMPGVDEKHDALTYFLRTLIAYLLEVSLGGRVVQDPVLMNLNPAVKSVRAPDLQVLPANVERLQGKEVRGPADLVIEVVSPGSQRVDRVEKFAEYERGGVREYWVLDFTYKEALFFQLNADGLYERQQPDADNLYQSAVLPNLRLPVDLLWRESLPTIRETIALVEAMLQR
jgi:Uma2 family endonuclease